MTIESTLDPISDNQMLALIESLENIEREIEVDLIHDGETVKEREVIFVTSVCEPHQVWTPTKVKLYIRRTPIIVKAESSDNSSHYEIRYQWTIGETLNYGMRLIPHQEAQLEAAFSDERKRSEAEKRARIHSLISRL